MTPNEYQELTGETEIYTQSSIEFLRDAPAEVQLMWMNLAYCGGKLNGEAGEVAELIFKALRTPNRGQISDEVRNKLIDELGDVQWYVARLAAILEVDLESVMQHNYQKLQKRKAEGTIGIR